MGKSNISVADMLANTEKASSKPQNKPAKGRTARIPQEVPAKPVRGKKGQKNAKNGKRAKSPFNVVEVAQADKIDSRYGSEVKSVRASLTFASGNVYGVSALLRCLGFYFGATGSSTGVKWLRSVGFAQVNPGTASQQCGCGKRCPAVKSGKGKGQPDNSEPGLHGSVPILDAADLAELKASFDAANPAE